MVFNNYPYEYTSTFTLVACMHNLVHNFLVATNLPHTAVFVYTIIIFVCRVVDGAVMHAEGFIMVCSLDQLRARSRLASLTVASQHSRALHPEVSLLLINGPRAIEILIRLGLKETSMMVESTHTHTNKPHIDLSLLMMSNDL